MQHILQGAFFLVIFFAPMFTGLYYEEEFLPFGIVTSLMLLCYLFFNKKDGIAFDKFDLLGVAVCLVYLISLSNAADLRLAYFGFLKYSAFFALFYLARRLFTDEKTRLNLINLVLLAITVSAVIGIIQKIVFLQVRMTGTFTYVNSFAIMLVAALIMLITCFVTCQSRLLKYVYTICSYLCLVSLLSTGSRGAFLVYGVSLLLLIIFSQHRLELIKTLIILHLFSLAGVIILYKFSGLLFILLFTMVGIVNTYILLILTKEVKIKKLLLITIPIVIMGLIYIYAKYPLQQFVPLNRLTKINFSDITRFVFYHDALKLYVQNWLIGSGSNSWTLLYYQVQTYPYIAKEVHSSIFRLLLEVGTIGIITVFAFVGAILYNFISRMRKHEASECEKGLCIAVIAMLIHSTIDFDLAFSSFVMYLFMFLGLLVHSSQANPGKRGVQSIAYLWFVVIFISCSAFFMANCVEKTTLADVENGKLAIAKFGQYKRDLKTAIVLDPLNSKYRLYLGQIMVAEGNNKKDQALLDSGVEEINKALRLAPRDYKNYIVKGNILFQLGNYEESADTYMKVIEMCPFKPIGYYNLSRTYVKMCIEKTDLSFADKAIEVYNKAYEQVQSVPEKYIKISLRENIADLDPYLNYQTGIAYALKGNNKQSLEHLKLAEGKKTGNYNEVIAWKKVISERLDIKINAEVGEKLINSIKNTLQSFNK